MTGRSLFAVDAGGSRTRVLLVHPDGGEEQFELASINPAAGAHGDRALDELCAGIRERLGAGPALGWLASASVDPTGVAPELARLRVAATRAGLAATTVVSNDVVPLLWGAAALGGVGVVLVCGTGSGFFGANAAGRTARAGGCEYLGSDEGSAVHMGLLGLRAAVRALDGRGPRTRLVEAFDAVELARELAATPFPKQGLAALAPAVCDTWLRGDRVAGGIVRHAVDELVAGVRAVRDTLALPEGFAVAAAGGVLTGCRPFHDLLADRLRTDLRAAEVELVEDTAAAVLAGLPRFLGSGRRDITMPSGFGGRHAWVLAPDPSPRRRHAVGTVSRGVR